MNQYIEYLAFNELNASYKNFLDLIEELEGEIPEEYLAEFLELEETVEETIFRAYNIRKEFEAGIKNRKLRIESLKLKNDRDEKKIEFFRNIEITLLKKKSEASGRNTMNFSDMSWTLSKSKSVIYDDTFNDKRFITYSIKDRLDEDTLNKLKAIVDLNADMVVGKDELGKALKAGEKITGASLQELDKLTVR